MMMAKKQTSNDKKHNQLLRPRKTPHGIPHNRSVKLQEFKKRNNLPEWQDVQKLHDLGLADEVERKIRNMERFATAQQILFEQMHAAGWDTTNLIHNYLDLQHKLWDLEAKIEAEGGNPLENPDWVKCRDMLAKEAQFIKKQDFDVAKFFTRERKFQEKEDDDSLFVVEGDGE